MSCVDFFLHTKRQMDSTYRRRSLEYISELFVYLDDCNLGRDMLVLFFKLSEQHNILFEQENILSAQDNILFGQLIT